MLATPQRYIHVEDDKENNQYIFYHMLWLKGYLSNPISVDMEIFPADMRHRTVSFLYVGDIYEMVPHVELSPERYKELRDKAIKIFEQRAAASGQDWVKFD